MKTNSFLPAISLILFSSCAGYGPETLVPEHTIWYDEEAEIWEETLPTGNGRLGMMPDGGITYENVVLNEISMWSGSEADYSNPKAAESLPEIRELLQQGRNAEAQELMYRSFVPEKPTDGGTYGSYQTLGNLLLKHDVTENVENYRRGLDLRTATAWTEFTHEGVDHYRKYHVSRNADIMVIELGASGEGNISFDASLTRRDRVSTETFGDGTVRISGELDSGSEAQGLRYSAYAVALAEGKKAETDGLSVRNADRAWILISAATSWFEGDDYDSTALGKLKAATAGFCGRKMDKSHRESVRMHQDLYDRACLSLGSEEESSFLPTDERLLKYAEGAEDNALAALYYHYGRYLLICSTRPGSLPPNLQGLWADTYQTPWNGDYHTNINVQMNHWIAEQGNLSELHLPLTDLIMKLIPSGERSARVFYGPEAEGWVQHMMTNVWNYTEPGEHPSWGATNTGGAWLCAHLWEHYLYTGDIDYLEKVYPALAGASRFFLSTMITDRNTGYLVTGPTSSPENAFWSDGKAVSICLGPTMDNQLVRELFRNTLQAAQILRNDKRTIQDISILDDIEDAICKLAPNRISNDGYLMEWQEDYIETDIHHRHVSHLYGLHPGNEISVHHTPELAEACRVTLNRRGDEATGWSRAWKLNFWARLGDGDRALKLFRSLLSPAIITDGESRWLASGTYPNLFCSHPPFQIDGNFGGAAGISEMLVQSQDGFINPLPALPAEWRNGKIKGFKVRSGSGAVVDMEWEDGKVTKMTITGGNASGVLIKHPETGEIIEYDVKPGKKRTIRF